MGLNWENVPFAIGANNLLREQLSTELPFTIGCGTQQGLDHKDESFSNQDALSLTIKDKHIIGVISDGCTSSASEYFNSISSNQVGANYISLCLSKILDDFLKEKAVADLIALVEEIEEALISKIKGLAGLIENESSNLFKASVINSLMATIVAFVVDDNNYAILNCGDGIVFLNGISIDLDQNQGEYIAIQMIENENIEKNKLRILASGQINNLNSLFISSDGFKEKTLMESRIFNSFINDSPELAKGFQKDFISTFRIKFINPYLGSINDYNTWPNDDASFILLRRVLAKQETISESSITIVEIEQELTENLKPEVEVDINVDSLLEEAATINTDNTKAQVSPLKKGIAKRNKKLNIRNVNKRKKINQIKRREK